MARGEQLARQWKILQYLLISRFGKSAADLAEQMQCNPRTIYRDLEALAEAGFPIISEKVKGKNIWSLLDTMKHRLPVPFTLQELMALHVSRGMVKIFKDTIFYDALESLFEKVETTLPPESKTYLQRVEQTLQIGFRAHKPYNKYKEIIAQVNNAAIAKNTIEIAYHTMSTGKKSRRQIDPYMVWFFNGSFYLIGHCHKRREVRIFAISRIKMLHVTDKHFSQPDDFKLDDYLGSSFGLFHGRVQNVKVWFSEKAAGYIMEQVWHESQRIIRQDDGSIIFSVEVAGTDEIKSWIMGWGAQARVLEPPKLQQEIAAEALVMAGYSDLPDRQRHPQPKSTTGINK
jgi:predicted DNA-binding transcriptional regulator YafY